VSQLDNQVRCHGAIRCIHRLDGRRVLAFRGRSRFTAGDVPFFDLCLFGTGGDLQGSTGGQYGDRTMLAGQVEYRRELPERFGLGASARVGRMAPALWVALLLYRFVF
jgi:hypothetical protein